MDNLYICLNSHIMDDRVFQFLSAAKSIAERFIKICIHAFLQGFFSIIIKSFKNCFANLLNIRMMCSCMSVNFNTGLHCISNKYIGYHDYSAISCIRFD